MKIDINRLRRDMADENYAGAFAGMPAMIMEAWDIERASDEEVIRKAEREGIDLSKYER